MPCAAPQVSFLTMSTLSNPARNQQSKTGKFTVLFMTRLADLDGRSSASPELSPPSRMTSRRPRSLVKDTDIANLLSDSESEFSLSGDDSYGDAEYKNPGAGAATASSGDETEEEDQNEEKTAEKAAEKEVDANKESLSSSRKRRLSATDMSTDKDVSVKENVNVPVEHEEGTDVENLSVQSQSGQSSGIIKWEGVRLWPPPESGKRKKRSIAWNHGGFVKDKTGQIERSQVVCGHCGVKLSYHGSPSSFLNHLNKTHPTEMGQKKEDESSVKKISDMFSMLGKTVNKYPDSHPRQKEHKKLTVDWVIQSLRSFRTVEDEGFIKIVNHADPKLKVISRRTLVREIEKRNETEVSKVQKMFENVDYFVCTNDGGSSKDTRSFIVVTLHWISNVKGNMKMNKKILGMIELTKDKKAKTYRSEVDKLLDKFKVKEKVFLFLTDNENTMKAAFSSLERNGCFPHIMSKACKYALEDQECLSNLRKKLKDIVSKTHRSPKLKNTLIREQQSRDIQPRTLVQEVETRFTATQLMISSFLNDKNHLSDLEIDETSAKLNIDAVNAALSDPEVGLKDEEISELLIKPSEVTMMINLMKVLEPIEEGVALTGGDSYPTGCVMIKYLRFLNKLLSSDYEDPSYIAKFKEKVLAEVEDRCQTNLNFEMLEKASFFDKRNDLKKLLGNEKTEAITASLTAELTELERCEVKPMICLCTLCYNFETYFFLNSS